MSGQFPVIGLVLRNVQVLRLKALPGYCDVVRWFLSLPEAQVLAALNADQRGAYLAELRRTLDARTQADGVYVGGTAWLVCALRCT